MFVLLDTYKFCNIALFDPFVGALLPLLKSGVVKDHPNPLQNYLSNFNMQSLILICVLLTLSI